MLFLTLLVDTIGFGMVLPILPTLFTNELSPAFLLHGYPAQMQFLLAGLVTALYGVMQFIAAPILGELSDAYGRKRILMIGVGVLALSQCLFGFAIEIGSIALILIARSIAGFAAANMSIAQAMIADVTAPHERAKNFGLIGAAFGVGMILGPFLGGWFSSFSGNVAVPFWLASAIGMLNILFVSLFLQETRKVSKIEEYSFTLTKGFRNVASALADTQARVMYSVNFLYMCGFIFFTSFIGVLLVKLFNLDEAGIGTFFALVGVCIFIGQIFVLRIVSRYYKEQQALRVSMLVTTVAVGVYPLLPNIAWAYALIPFHAAAQAVTMANITSLVSRSVSAEKQGVALGINASLVALAQAVVPLLAGVIAVLVGVSGPFLAAAIFTGFAWVLFLRRGGAKAS